MNSTPQHPDRTAVTAGAYVALALLGVMEGVIGCFQYGSGPAGVPVVAWVLCLVVFATCLLAGLGMGTTLGAFVPAVTWFGASFVLTLPTPGGSVIVTSTPAGEWYLYGGAACAMIAVMAVYVVRLRALSAHRSGRGHLPPGPRR